MPDGQKIMIGMNRLPASNTTQRIGSLIYNPGGPGASGSSLIEAQAQGLPILTEGVGESFDLIGLDPRGIALSTRVNCDPDIYNERVSLVPNDTTSYQALVAHNTALGESCLELTGELFYHLDTRSAALDIESVRIALGNEKLNFLGISYGTQLGAQ